jgi:hypothetical protein
MHFEYYYGVDVDLGEGLMRTFTQRTTPPWRAPLQGRGNIVVQVVTSVVLADL